MRIFVPQILLARWAVSRLAIVARQAQSAEGRAPKLFIHDAGLLQLFDLSWAQLEPFAQNRFGVLA